MGSEDPFINTETASLPLIFLYFPPVITGHSYFMTEALLGFQSLWTIWQPDGTRHQYILKHAVNLVSESVIIMNRD